MSQLSVNTMLSLVFCSFSSGSIWMSCRFVNTQYGISPEVEHKTHATIWMKKRSERRKHCILAVVRRSQEISPRGGQNLISWRWSVHLPINPVWWGLMYAIRSYHSNIPTHTHRNTHTHPSTNKQTGPITIHCAAASAQCKDITLRHAMTCDAAHPWNRHTVLNVYCFSQSTIAVSY